MPTEEGNGYPKGVVLPGLVNINLEEPENTLYSDDCLFLRDTEVNITGEFKTAEPKMSRKRFKWKRNRGHCLLERSRTRLQN